MVYRSRRLRVQRSALPGFPLRMLLRLHEDRHPWRTTAPALASGVRKTRIRSGFPFAFGAAPKPISLRSRDSDFPQFLIRVDLMSVLPSRGFRYGDLVRLNNEDAAKDETHM